ncbi:type IV pilus modification PilV family protein [Agarilytica rhodophyticola]|uniref:type IV pilus modification PilV family protein n=1 Tax=Agarilytica rhodophyticola TaxID=1737490 RepID=UPI000B347663|nr:type II secretion system protein [Agarilytica rhodophyticola]
MHVRYYKGVTLIETIVFLTVVSIAIVALVKVYSYAIINSVDPLIKVQALEHAQAQLDEILARKFDENTPTGGVPACDSGDGPACLGISPDGDFDDVGDYNGFIDTSNQGHTISVSVIAAGSELGGGMANSAARRITVVVTSNNGDSVTLSAYKTNF